MNTHNVDPLAQLDSLIQITLRQRLLAALQKPGITLEELSKMAKLYQKSIDQELKAKALEIKKQELALKTQKLAADQAQEARKKDAEGREEKPAREKARVVAPAPSEPDVKPVLLQPAVSAVLGAKSSTLS